MASHTLDVWHQRQDYVISGMNLRVNSSCTALSVSFLFCCILCILLTSYVSYVRYAKIDYVRVSTYPSGNRIGAVRIALVDISQLRHYLNVAFDRPRF